MITGMVRSISSSSIHQVTEKIALSNDSWPVPLLFHKLALYNLSDDLVTQLMGSHVDEALRLDAWKSDSEIYHDYQRERHGPRINPLNGLVWYGIRMLHRAWLNLTALIVTVALVCKLLKLSVSTTAKVPWSVLRFVGRSIRFLFRAVLPNTRRPRAPASSNVEIRLRQLPSADAEDAQVRDSFIRSSIRRLAPRFLTDAPPELTELHESFLPPGMSLTSEAAVTAAEREIN